MPDCAYDGKEEEDRGQGNEGDGDAAPLSECLLDETEIFIKLSSVNSLILGYIVERDELLTQVVEAWERQRSTCVKLNED